MNFRRYLKSIFIGLLLVSVVSLQATLYEDAEDGDTQGNVPPNVRGWFVYDNTPAGAQILNVYDAVKDSQVIQFSGAPNSGTNNGYMLGNWYPTLAGNWNNTSEFNVHWCSRYSEYFVVYMRVYTTKFIQFVYNGVNYNTNQRYLYYIPGTGAPYWSPHKAYIRHRLGANVNNGQWQSFNRDLQADLHAFEPDNNITSVVAFLIRGSGKVDDIYLTATPMMPRLSLKKTARTLFDPVNGQTNPKSIPGAIVEYTLHSENTGFQLVDNNSTVIEDKIPANMKVCVADSGQCKKPYLVSNSNTSGLSLGSIAYKINGAYVTNPAADAGGFHGGVSAIKITMNGRFLDKCSGSPAFEIKFRTAIK